MEDGSKTVALFNKAEEPKEMVLHWIDLGMTGNHIVRDLWQRKDRGTFRKSYSAIVPSHGVTLIRISGVNFTKLFPKEAKPFNFYGFQGYDFTFRNRNTKIVVPKNVAAGHPWIWRARFWGHEPQADIALLERGFHVVYCDVAELFGNKEAVSIWNDFYKGLTRAGLAQKSVMEGMSRGGVYIYRWAAAYPNRFAGVYADAPVLDLIRVSAPLAAK